MPHSSFGVGERERTHAHGGGAGAHTRTRVSQLNEWIRLLKVCHVTTPATRVDARQEIPCFGVSSHTYICVDADVHTHDFGPHGTHNAALHCTHNAALHCLVDRVIDSSPREGSDSLHQKLLCVVILQRRAKTERKGGGGGARREHQHGRAGSSSGTQLAGLVAVLLCARSHMHGGAHAGTVIRMFQCSLVHTAPPQRAAAGTLRRTSSSKC
ncbi:hypothetical protein CUR178_05851 [Leishmania enriettii]|uniref:Uncharacterized protein n=1 Tax=Leishmania enriettii TaxID=5663 RepID=A0A836HMH5_LEIEN|nr:hypothetical protein CUR178_05851 [Leishmania enriettii]